MKIIDTIYELKKRIISFFKRYFTVDGVYDCILPDRIYIQQLYKKRFGTKLDLKNPKTYNEKINWMKLYYHPPIYTKIADKYAAREYITEKAGSDYLVPLVGVWDSVDDIPFSELPEQFVLKCNHNNGVVICRDKSTFDIDAAKKKLSAGLQCNYYKKLREWPYKNIKRKVICEALLSNSDGTELYDYKFFCFNGQPKFFYIGSNKEDPEFECFNFYDLDFNPLRIYNGHPVSEIDFKKPKAYNEMLELCKKLSKDIPFLRVDFYYADEKLYLGEMTFYHYGGFRDFEPLELNRQFGDWITLPDKYK